MELNFENFNKKESLKIHKQEKKYSLESGINVGLKIQEFTPQQANDFLNPDEAVFVLPGWGTDAHTPVVENLAQEYANSFNQKTFSLSSRAEQHSTENENIRITQEESRAIMQYIVDSGKKEITLTGYSQGGNKAIDVVSLLQQEHPEIDIKGLVLVGPVGLYHQEKIDIVKNFNIDALIGTPKKILENGNKISDIKNAASSILSILQYIMKEVTLSNVHFFDRFNRELEELGEKNPHLAEITAPVVLISGSDDLVSKREQFIPQDQENRLREELTNATTSDIREHYLRKNCFTHSPYVRILLPTKNGTHSLPYFRPKSVANASKGMLDRYYRNKK